MKRIAGIIMATLLVSGSIGCQTKAQTGALIGAGGGAVAGQAIGHDTKSTLIGAGVGAVGGALIGNELDKRDARESSP